MWTRSYTASWGDVYTHFLFWASFFLEYFFENPAQKRINLAFLSTFLSKLIPFEQFIPFLSTFLSTFLSNIQQKYFFEHFFEYSKKYSKCWVLFWVLFWELFWGFFWDFHYDKTYLMITNNILSIPSVRHIALNELNSPKIDLCRPSTNEYELRWRQKDGKTERQNRRNNNKD